jgi:peptidyl-prolyl cis-trans isomerase SurA
VKKPCWPFLFALVLLVPIAGRSEVTNRIVAIVNDDIVTLREVERFVAVEKESRYTSMKEYLRNLALRDKIDNFIESLLVTQQARKLKIEVGDKEVEGAIENIRKQNLISESDLKEQLKRENIEYKDFYEGIKTSIMRNRVLARTVTQEIAVDDKNLRAYYDRHAEDFVDEEYKLQLIFISRQNENGAERAREALALLDSGKPFGEVARQFSDERSKDEGGDIGYVKKEDLMPELRDAIKGLTPGAYTKIVQTPYGYHILRLNEAKEGAPPDFETVRDKVKEAFIQTETEKRYKQYVGKLKSSSYIEVKM